MPAQGFSVTLGTGRYGMGGRGAGAFPTVAPGCAPRGTGGDPAFAMGTPPGTGAGGRVGCTGSCAVGGLPPGGDGGGAFVVSLNKGTGGLPWMFGWNLRSGGSTPPGIT